MLLYYKGMEQLINGFFADPMYYLGICFAFVAAIAFLAFIRGFFTSFPHLLTIAAHEGHLKNYHFRVTWGAVGLFGLLLAWETLRWVLSWFGVGDAPNTEALGTLWSGYLIVGLILWALFSIKGAVVNKSH